MTVKDQLEHIKNFAVKPDFVVHIKVRRLAKSYF